jgi:hypothetical protein
VPCGRRALTLWNAELDLQQSEMITVRPGQRWKRVFQLADTGD